MDQWELCKNLLIPAAAILLIRIFTPTTQLIFPALLCGDGIRTGQQHGQLLSSGRPHSLKKWGSGLLMITVPATTLLILLIFTRGM